MHTEIKSGVWPVMLTPFTENGMMDRIGCEALVDWYLENGVAGIFTACLSSEMFHLSESERIELADWTVKRTKGRVSVASCGGFGKNETEQIDSIRRMADTGVDVVILPLGVIFPEALPESRVEEKLLSLPDRLPGIQFGLYECPVPYKRLISTELLGRIAENSTRYRFMKDTCCDRRLLRARSAAVAGHDLKIFNANLTTLTDSLRSGCAGFCGIAANFFPDALVEHARAVFAEPARADEMQLIFNTLERNAEFHYPRGAKTFLRCLGLPITDVCRTPAEKFNAEELEQIRDFSRFIALWKQADYRFPHQSSSK